MMAQNIKKPTLFTIGLLLVLFWILVAIFAEMLAPYHPDARFISLARANSINADGGVFMFGTDWLGRDILSRLLIAAQNMVSMTLIAGFIAFAVGVICGTIAGYYQGYADRLLSFVSWVLRALPIIVLLILIRYHYGLSEFYSMVAASLVVIPYIFKHVRALVMNVKKRDFILVAKIRGEKSLYIIGREIFPNIMKPLLADFLVRCSQILIVIALIGFLELGVSSLADWGSMAREGQEYIAVMGYYLFVPCLAIISLVLGLNLISVAIQDNAIQDNMGTR